MAQDFLFLVGRIRALESRLLSQSQIDRMVGARDADEAFRILTELQYADYIGESAQPSQFEQIVNQGLSETKQLIESGTDHHPAFQFIWREFDLNNLKRALKEKLVENRESIGDFTEENGYSQLGNITAKDLEAAVFGLQFDSEVPEPYMAVVRTADKWLDNDGSFRDIEFALDVAHFEYLQTLVQQTPTLFLRNYLTLLADEANTRTCARVLLAGETLSSDLLVDGGSFEYDTVKGAQDIDSLVEILKHTEMNPVARKLQAVAGEEVDETLLTLERMLSDHRYDFLHEAESGEISTVQVPLYYFMKRLQNARVIKFIMFSKLYDIAPAEIYKTLKHL